MHVADQFHVGGKLLQYTCSAVGAVAADDQLLLRKPACHQGNQLHRQFRPGAVIGIALRWFLLRSLLLVLLFSLGQALAIAIKPIGDPQAPDLGRSPKGTADNQGHYDPVVPPTGQGLGTTGNQGIVVHPRAIDGQPALSTKRVVHSQLDHAGRRENGYQQLRQHAAERIQTPSCLAEETMVAAVMPLVGTAAGPDQLGDETAAMGKNPSCHETHEDQKARLGENALELG